ncbi:tetratricopeptide repeat protein [Streptomyces sp. BE133]|uniref:tetratricopeptide repeat protein n=1 Tax=Streptomyces sp. BE133 TaxID=3002523 RepID=UPI002E76BE2C|nr:tetratricopeptide repeat protein [Streptomyces sp. BE133]MEE1811599.1 tetratricopeptide repeat protein [Streptomyces sp. BE133]
MDVTPQQPPQSPDSTEPPLEPPGTGPAPPDPASPDPAPSELPPLSLRTTLRRAAMGAVAGAVLVTGAVVAVPEDEKKSAPPPAPGPVSRALKARNMGSPASLSDLTALIGDRQQWVGTHPSDAPSWALLGTAYVEWGQRSADAAYYSRAEQALKRSLDVQPGENGNTAAWVGLATLANARHDFVTAKKWGETVRARQPKQWNVYPALIDAYNGLGDYESANTAVEKFTALHSGAPALIRTAQRYRDLGRREDAQADAQAAADRATTPAQKAECLYLLGELAWERGEPDKAVAQYSAALRTDRAHPSLAGRARALVALGRTDEAERDYKAALANLPRPEYMLALGELYESLGRDEDARSQYAQLGEALARDDGEGVDNATLRGRFETDHGDPAAAVKLLKAEWDRSHRSAAVADALGWALHRSGDSSSALQYATRAVDTDGQNASYMSHLGAIQQALKDYGPARRNLAEALLINPHFSPLEGPAAQKALDSLGGPPADVPQGMQPARAPGPAPEPRPVAPAPQRQAPAKAPASHVLSSR